MSTAKTSGLVETGVIGALAGIAGGLAEIAWVAFYGAATGTRTDAIARGIIASVVPAWATSSGAIWLGILFHLGLAVGLGLSLALVIRHVLRRTDTAYSEFALVMSALAAVWAVSFLVALPRANPQFVHLLPYGVTLLSKLPFGLSAAAVFRADRRRRARMPGRGAR